MGDPTLLLNLGIIIVCAAGLVLLSQKIRVPTIIAYIVAGLMLGPLTGILHVSPALEVISEVGIVLLLFLVGLELSLDKIKDVGRVAVMAGIGQVIFTAVGGWVIAYLLGFTVMEAIFIATALTFSSTVVVVKLLDQKKEINDLYGRIAVGIFLVQDLVVIVALTFLAGLAAPEDTETGNVVISIGFAFGGMALLLAVVLGASRYVLPGLFRWIASSSGALFIWSLCWCFVIVLGAELLHLSPEIGAFLAGLSLAQLPYNHDLRRRVHPLMNFFIAVFFVSLGIQMELDAAATHWSSAIVLSLFVLIGNPIIFMWIIARMGYGERTSFLTSVTVAQISEFSFIFAAMGMAAGLIDETILSLIAVVGLVTISVSAYMILYNHQLYRVCRKLSLLKIFAARQQDEAEADGGLANHVIIVGVNSLSHYLIKELMERGETVLVIDIDPAKLESIEAHTLLGNVEYPSVLEEAGFERAKLLISALQIEDTNNYLAYRCHEQGIPCSIHAFDRSVIDELRDLKATHLMASKNEGIKQVAQSLYKRIRVAE